MKQLEQSKIWMTKALFALMRTKKYSTITIKEITEKAGVSRLTFYRNFESKEDIIRYHMNSGFREYMEELDVISDLRIEQMIELCYSVWGKNREEIRMLSEQKLDWLLREPFESYLHAVLERLSMEDKYTFFQIQFLLGGMFSDMLAWIKDPQGRTPQSIAKEIMAIIKV